MTGGMEPFPACGRVKFALALAMSLLPLPALALDIEGHRGARGLMPENTLPAFARALSLGVHTLELDTAVTKDGVVVISHDPVLNPNITRGPDGKWLEAPGPAIVTLTYEELSRYDVGRLKPGTRYAEGFPEQKPMDGTRIPRLADLFDLVHKSGNRAVRFDIEIKTDPRKPHETLTPEKHAEHLVEAIRAGGMMARVTIQSFHWPSLRRVRTIAPDIPTACLTAQQTWLNNVVDPAWTAPKKLSEHGGSVPRLVRAAGCKTWSAHYRDVTEALVREAHLQRLKVAVWTVNEMRDMGILIAMGVDSIITDRPDLLRQALTDNGLPVPKPTPVTP